MATSLGGLLQSVESPVGGGLGQGFLQGLLKIGAKQSAVPPNSQSYFDEAVSGARYQNVLRPYTSSNNLYGNADRSRPLHINTISGSLSQQQQLYTPSRISRIFSSSPSNCSLIISSFCSPVVAVEPIPPTSAT